jgi:hypothetical protein
MKISINVNSPSMLNKVAELATTALALGKAVEFVIDVPEDQARAVLATYLDWTAPVAPVAMPQPEAPVQTAPVAMPQPAAPVALNGLLDARGVPWNADLHAAQGGRTGGRNEGGEWKLRRGGNRDAYLAWRLQHAKPVTADPVQFADNRLVAMPPMINPFAAAPVLTDPGEAAISAKATQLAQAGLLTPPEVNKLMIALGVTDNNALLQDPAVRPRLWVLLAELEARTNA